MHPCGAVGQRGALGNRPDEVGGERYFFCNEQNEKGEPVTWQGAVSAYPIQGSGFELNGKGTSTRPRCVLTCTDGHRMGKIAESGRRNGGRRKVYARFWMR
ncbi:hypothetical protein [Escherichia coli]|uniref:hypothetical protein n=1 Tax=Escherichia coli TaxID=562 RepID=UPI003D80A606